MRGVAGSIPDGGIYFHFEFFDCFSLPTARRKPIQVKSSMTFIQRNWRKEIDLKKKRRSDSVLWQNPLYQQKIRKPKDNTETPPKTSITQRLQTDLGRSVWVTSPPTCVVKPIYGYPTFPLAAKAILKIWWRYIWQHVGFNGVTRESHPNVQVRQSTSRHDESCKLEIIMYTKISFLIPLSMWLFFSHSCLKMCKIWIKRIRITRYKFHICRYQSRAKWFDKILAEAGLDVKACHLRLIFSDVEQEVLLDSFSR